MRGTQTYVAAYLQRSARRGACAAAGSSACRYRLGNGPVTAPGAHSQYAQAVPGSEPAGQTARPHRAELCIWPASTQAAGSGCLRPCRSEEHKSELKSLMRISYAVSCLKINKTNK